MEFVLAIVVCVTLSLCLRNHGLFSFVTLGVLGAAIYSLPGVLDMERPIFSFGLDTPLFFPTPDKADSVMAAAWCGLLAGVLLFRPRPGEGRLVPMDEDQRRMLGAALACAILASAGLLYLIYLQGAGIFVESRAEQTSDAFLLLWKWTAPLGLLASTFAKNRKLAIFHAFILFLVFLRGDRTLVAITAAAMLVAISRDQPKWYLLLRPSRTIGIALAAIGVFFGKSVYNVLKSGLGGEGASLTGLTLKDQFYFQFEPFLTYSHLDFVMRHGLHIPLGKFLVGIFSNLLIVPSFFGFSSNTYATMIQRAAPLRIDFGLAGNYVANGYAVGGTAGAVVFYFLLAWILRQCDSRFYRGSGAWKLFWCCTGATFAFYAHRNGLDNIVSFIRQIAIACVTVAVVARVMSPAARRDRTSEIGPAARQFAGLSGRPDGSAAPPIIG